MIWLVDDIILEREPDDSSSSDESSEAQMGGSRSCDGEPAGAYSFSSIPLLALDVAGSADVYPCGTDSVYALAGGREECELFGLERVLEGICLDVGQVDSDDHVALRYEV